MRKENKKILSPFLSFLTREVQMENKKSRLFRSCDWARKNKNGERKDRSSIGLASSQVGQGCTKILGTS